MAISAEKSLYERMGGYDAIAAATDDLLQRLTSDPDIGFYWRGHSTDSMKRDRQLIVDFRCPARRPAPPAAPCRDAGCRCQQ